jgi:hypothetical protein
MPAGLTDPLAVAPTCLSTGEHPKPAHQSRSAALVTPRAVVPPHMPES